MGKLVPFNDEEIDAFLNRNYPDIDAQEFIANAKTNNAIELLRNPQYLVRQNKAIRP